MLVAIVVVAIPILVGYSFEVVRLVLCWKREKQSRFTSVQQTYREKQLCQACATWSRDPATTCVSMYSAR